jgi:hypothetical protein
MPQVVPPEAFNARSFERRHEDTPHVVARVDRRFARVARKHEGAFQSAGTLAQRLAHGLTHGHTRRQR